MASRPSFDDVPDTRRRNMAAIRGKDTAPELVVRKMLHALGYRFRLHRRDLPGKPDIVLPRLRRVIEVRGCFWHRHQGCVLAAVPSTRPAFWTAKFAATVARDACNLDALELAGWNVLVLWQCEIGNHERLRERLVDFLADPGNAHRRDAPTPPLAATPPLRTR